MQNYEDVKIKSVDVITITPEIAKEMLLKNEGNRKLSQKVVLTYADDMKNGRWKQTHQGMAIDESGKIIDGQHRLSAIVKSGFPIITTLTTFKGNLNTIFIPIDRGKNRTLVDLTGVGYNEASVMSTMCSFFSSIGGRSKLDPITAMTIYNSIKPEMDYIKEVTDLSLSTSGQRKNSIGLSRIWTAPVKTSLVIGLLDNIDISVVKEFNNEVPRTKAFKEYIEWLSEAYVKSGSQAVSVIITCMFWNVLKYKKFILPNNFDEIDSNKAEIRNILKKRFPDIFGK